jgi:hypothetical protein
MPLRADVRGKLAVDAKLAALENMSLADLEDQWRRITRSPAPKISPSLMRLALAWEIQERAYGGMPREVTRELHQIAAGKTVTCKLRPGMRLTREWRGQSHVVMIGEDRSIIWADRTWRSLSQIAKVITGTHWSGPAFFGLRKTAE